VCRCSTANAINATYYESLTFNFMRDIAPVAGIRRFPYFMTDLCSSPPYLFQTKVDRRMREYTDLAFAGEVARAKAVRDSLNPVREAFRRSRPPEKPPSHSKYWQELLGQVGGRVRPPMLELTDHDAPSRGSWWRDWDCGRHSK
jgi:hypothetical protein